MTVIDLDRILTPEIQRPARYIGKESGAAYRAWDSAQVRWVLTYPEVYEVGASNLGHIILYNILNTQLDQLCDRAYLPGPDLAQRLREQQIPLFAVESRRPLSDFHILGFSLAYELGGTNVLEMLDLAGIPLTWADRNSMPLSECPLIFAGGPTATSNPEPFAQFFDFFVLGDGEEVLPEIGQVIQDHLQDPRRDLLLGLAQVPGVYVPQFYAGTPPQPLIPTVPQRIQRRVAQPLPEYSVGLIPLVSTVHDRLTMEVRRGCTRGCRFCQPGMLTRPARDVDPARLMDAITQGIQQTGYDEFSLASLSCSDYLSLPYLGAELQQQFQARNISLSLPSQRVDRFDDRLAQIMGGNRRPSLTFAPEAGTQRLRDIINKGLTDADLIRGITTAARQGWDKVKLYFIIGLPGEQDEDVIGIAHTLKRLKQECAAVGVPRMKFTLTLSNFTPKPHTPFQWHRVDYAEIQRKQALLRAHLRPLKGVKANFTDIRFSILEDLVGKGTRELSPMIYRAWQMGAAMDSWFENIEAAFAAWVQAYQGTATPPATPTDLPLHHFDLTDPLPWDHIDTGIDKTWLQKDYQRALAAMTVEDCSFEGCSACGICGPEFGHNILISPPDLPDLPPQPQPPTQTPSLSQAPIPSAQRFRITYTKQGDLRWLGHLDLMRLWERACRRAGLPLAFTGGYHPTPKLANANALPIGHTSQGEILDLELIATEICGSPLTFTPTDLRRLLQPQLPPEITLRSLQEIPLDTPAATQEITAADYQLLLSATPTSPQIPPADLNHWQDWIEQIHTAQHLWLQKTTKSGKTVQIDSRALLYQIQAQSPSGDVIPTLQTQPIHYRGCCRNDGSFLQPKQVVQMIQQMAGSRYQIQLVAAERVQLVFASTPLALAP